MKLPCSPLPEVMIMNPNQFITEPIRRSWPIGKLETRRTAAEALALVEPAARNYDRQARLVLMVSGSDIDLDGRSGRWELLWDFPTRQAQAVYVAGLLDDKEYGGSEADALVEEVRPFPSASSQAEQMGRGSLPLNFRNSPAAVSSLAELGVDFVAGDTSMVLTARTLPGGEAVWEVMALGVPYRTPLEGSVEGQE
jgi:hypothetical protein